MTELDTAWLRRASQAGIGSSVVEAMQARAAAGETVESLARDFCTTEGRVRLALEAK